MRELRAARVGEGAEARAALREFAAAWPGALKELDTLPTEEIERRFAACSDGADEPWMAWSARYHELMRAALAIRRDEAPSAGDRAPKIDDEFVRAVKRPRHGRINVVVFAQLEREFEVDARTIWDALFPPRGRAPRDYRR
ncbi:MAG: uncharacterized protein JWM53_4156 [bacterium]|nr:uncharacterized protein [bacterium]